MKENKLKIKSGKDKKKKERKNSYGKCFRTRQIIKATTRKQKGLSIPYML